MKITKLEYQKKDSNKMDIFIDESGVGRKIGYSVYCLTMCPSREKKQTDEEIQLIESKLNIQPFHWREQSWKIKKIFLQKILKLNSWNCIVCIVDNKTHPFETPQQIIAKGLLGIHIKTVYIDGKKTRKYTYAVKKSLQELELNISSLKMVTSSSCGGLRIADGVAGLVRLSLESPLDKEVVEILKQINKKITTQIVNGYLPNPPHGR